MAIGDSDDQGKIPSREITPPESYFNRRRFLRGAIFAGSVAATAGIYRYLNNSTRADVPLTTRKLTVGGGLEPLPATGPSTAAPPSATKMTREERIAAGYFVDEPQTPLEKVAGYNNYYEFGTDKNGVAVNAEGFEIKPYLLSVEGLCNKPRVFDLDDLAQVAPIEERVYRHRCVERWSMVIPWLGYPLAALLKKVDPKSDAKYVAFQSYFDAKKMPHAEYLPWPYVEGLRMDEAMHPLALLALGLYGQVLLPQNGAPARLVCPWKYGFKNAKAIVKITLMKDQPPTSWSTDQPDAYGFYCNVNPDVARPWTQSEENRFPTGETRKTLPFNGYASQVAGLYKGMDLSKYY